MNEFDLMIMFYSIPGGLGFNAQCKIATFDTWESARWFATQAYGWTVYRPQGQK